MKDANAGLKEDIKAAKIMKKEAARKAAALASKEHYERMRHAGFKKYGIFLMAETMRQIRIIADAKGVTLYQIVEDVLSEYIKNYKHPPKQK
jgi:hypothetical protein